MNFTLSIKSVATMLDLHIYTEPQLANLIVLQAGLSRSLMFVDKQGQYSICHCGWNHITSRGQQTTPNRDETCMMQCRAHTGK